MKKQLLYLVIVLLSVNLHAQKRNYNVGILLDHESKELAPVLDDMKTQVKAVVGEDATISFPSQSLLYNEYNLQRAEANYQTLLNNNTDIILAFGVVNSVVVNKQLSYRKPTILFGAVNTDVVDIDLKQERSGIRNFTYLVQNESFEQDLTTLQNLIKFKKVGVAVDSHLAEMLPLNKAMTKVGNKLGFNYKIISFNKASDITSQLGDVDALYLVGGFFFTQDETKQLATTLIEKKIPSFTTNGVNQVNDGLMATNQSDDNYDQFLRRIALTIEGYVNGRPLENMPVYIDINAELTVNYNTAEIIGVPIKYSGIAQTNFVGEFENAISKKRYTLQEVISEVLDRNLTLQSGQKDILVNEQNVKTAKSNYYPSLTASATGTYVDPKAAEISNGQNPEFSTAGNLTLQQTVFSEAANANITIQKNLKKAQEETYNANELTTVFNASNAYFNVLILKANAQIQLRNLELTKRNLQLADQNFTAGQKGKTDVLRFRSQMAQNTQSMIQAVNQVEQGFISLNQLLNNPVTTEIDIEDETLEKGAFKDFNYDVIRDILDNPKQREPFINFLIEEAKKNAPEIKALNYNLEATERNIKLNSSGRFLPTVALQGQYNRTFSRSGKGSTVPEAFAAFGSRLLDDNYNVGVNVSIPVFNRTQTNINRQTAMIQKDQLEINKENAELTLESNVANAVYSLINQVANIELSKVSEATAKESLELTQTAYSNGAVNIVQLIDAQNNYLNAQLASASATYNFLINALQLERSIAYFFILNSQEDNTAFRQRFLEYMNNN